MVDPTKKTSGKYLGAVAVVLSALSSTSAQATCPTFHTLTNGTTADASQVMDNFNSILQCPNFTGNVGIGMTPAYVLDVTQNQNGASRLSLLNNSTGTYSVGQLLLNNGTHTGQFSLQGPGYTTNGQFKQDGLTVYSDGAGGLTFTTGAAQPIYFAINNSEKMRLDNSGRLLLNTTSPLGSAETLSVLANNTTNPAGLFKQTANAAAALAIWNSDTAGDNYLVRFYTDGGTERGSITYSRSGGLTAYNTTSDYRLKDLFGEFTDSGRILDAIPVHLGRMKGAEMKRPMFVAHEVQTYLPWAVTGEKDGVDGEGNIIAQQLDEPAMIATLWAEVKSLRARLQRLEAKEP